MKKVFYNSWLAKTILLAGYSTITLAAWVFTKYSELRQAVINHECTHARQWVELTIISGILLWAGLLIWDYSAWWLAVSAIVFYIWYGFEWCIRALIASVMEDKEAGYVAYRLVSFEQEARMAEEDDNYLENSHYLAWLKFYGHTYRK